MLDFDHNTNPQLPTELMKQIHSIELKKPTMIYTSSHIDKLLGQLNDLLIRNCGVYPYKVSKEADFVARQYSLYITSGNDESNKNLVYGAITSFKRITKNKPHVIMCETDNVLLLKYLNQIKINDDADVEIVSINVQGNSITKIIEKAIKPGKTCLIIISCVNTIFGSMNNISKIGEIAHKHSIPIHVNCSYIFGSVKINPYENNMDSFAIDFSQIGNVTNFGILGIKKELLDGYQLDKAAHDFSPNISNKIDPISLQISINTISAIYGTRKMRLAKQRKTRTLMLKLFKKSFNVLSLMEWLKNGKDVEGKRTIVFLFIGTDNSTTCNNILSFIPIGFSDAERKKISQLANYDKIDKMIIYHYKTIFREVFKKANKDIGILDHMYTLSWDDKITATHVTNYVKLFKKIVGVK
jgi:hypothetical protein